MRLTAEDLITEAYDAIVSGDSRDTTFRGETRKIWIIEVHPDGTTSLL